MWVYLSATFIVSRGHCSNKQAVSERNSFLDLMAHEWESDMCLQKLKKSKTGYALTDNRVTTFIEGLRKYTTELYAVVGMQNEWIRGVQQNL